MLKNDITIEKDVINPKKERLQQKYSNTINPVTEETEEILSEYEINN